MMGKKLRAIAKKNCEFVVNYGLFMLYQKNMLFDTVS